MQMRDDSSIFCVISSLEFSCYWNNPLTDIYRVFTVILTNQTLLLK